MSLLKRTMPPLMQTPRRKRICLPYGSTRSTLWTLVPLLPPTTRGLMTILHPKMKSFPSPCRMLVRTLENIPSGEEGASSYGTCGDTTVGQCARVTAWFVRGRGVLSFFVLRRTFVSGEKASVSLRNVCCFDLATGGPYVE
jgi:hypothetical protein